MKKMLLFFIAALFLVGCNNHSPNPESTKAEVVPVSKLPKPSHIVMLILENHKFSQIIGSDSVPGFNALAKDSHSVLFTRSYAVAHPSEPNYLALFCGSTMGVKNDEIPVDTPFTTPNLARQLLDSGYTFAIYSENLPSVGYNGKYNDVQKYARKHNPVPNWIGNGVNQIPASTNQPFTAFPANFDSLPAFCYVIPNQDNDMHDGSPAQADKWYTEHLNDYRKWAATHNSLLIVTFDEDDYSADNQIATIFSGAAVKPGEDSTHITHYSVLRTIEDIYHLPYAGHAAEATNITDCWK